MLSNECNRGKVLIVSEQEEQSGPENHKAEHEQGLFELRISQEEVSAIDVTSGLLCNVSLLFPRTIQVLAVGNDDEGEVEDKDEEVYDVLEAVGWEHSPRNRCVHKLWDVLERKEQ